MTNFRGALIPPLVPIIAQTLTRSNQAEVLSSQSKAATSFLLNQAGDVGSVKVVDE